MQRGFFKFFIFNYEFLYEVKMKMKRVSLNLKLDEYERLSIMAEDNRLMLVSLLRLILTDFVKNDRKLELYVGDNKNVR